MATAKDNEDVAKINTDQDTWVPETDQKAPGPVDQKKADAQAKLDCELHTLLIMKQDGISRSKAVYRAWAESSPGLARRSSVR